MLANDLGMFFHVFQAIIEYFWVILCSTDLNPTQPFLLSKTLYILMCSFISKPYFNYLNLKLIALSTITA